jgi:hypothetical protein
VDAATGTEEEKTVLVQLMKKKNQGLFPKPVEQYQSGHPIKGMEDYYNTFYLEPKPLLSRNSFFLKKNSSHCAQHYKKLVRDWGDG